MKDITVFSKHNETKKRKKDFIQAVSSTHRTEKNAENICKTVTTTCKCVTTRPVTKHYLCTEVHSDK